MTVVVTGLGVLCASAEDPAAFGQQLRDGRSGITWRDGDGPPVAAELAGFDFPAALARLPGQHATALRVAGRSPLSVQASVVVALQAAASAGLAGSRLPSHRLGLVVAAQNLGAAYAERIRPLFESSPVHLPPRYALHHLDTNHVGTVSEVLAITGEGYTVGGASASGNVALINGARLIEAGAVDACLVIGALTELSPMERQAYANLGAMAGGGDRDGDPRTRCRPFDAARTGFVPGQGAACLVLESAGSAAGRDAVPLARIAGHAQCLDANSLADPNQAGQVRVMSLALKRAGLTPGDVDYINAHATGSRLGDQTEAAAIHEVFGTHRPWVNSTKALTGHCLCAAGVVEAVATIIQMRAGFVHPCANLCQPIEPALRFAGSRAQPATVTVALSNGFGFGGFNTSVVFTRPAPERPSHAEQLQ